MAWTPVLNYFALVAVGHKAVLMSHDDFAYLVERRAIMEELAKGTVKFALLWGLDGAPVTRWQADRLLKPDEFELDVRVAVDVESVVDGQTVIKQTYETRKVKRMGPVPPRTLRPEALPGPAPRPRPYDYLEPHDRHGRANADIQHTSHSGCARCGGVFMWG